MDYESYSPSPEELYIRNETVFLRILKEYKAEKRSIGDIISAYLTIWDCGFNFPAIKKEYEKQIDDKFEDGTEINWYLKEKEEKSFNILKERYLSIKRGYSKYSR